MTIKKVEYNVTVCDYCGSQSKKRVQSLSPKWWTLNECKHLCGYCVNKVLRTLDVLEIAYEQEPEKIGQLSNISIISTNTKEADEERRREDDMMIEITNIERANEEADK